MKKVDGSYVCPDGHGMTFLGPMEYEDGTYTAFFACQDYLCGYQKEFDIPIEIYDLLKSQETKLKAVK
jgi:hypothetical protein